MVTRRNQSVPKVRLVNGNRLNRRSDYQIKANGEHERINLRYMSTYKH